MALAWFQPVGRCANSSVRERPRRRIAPGAKKRQTRIEGKFYQTCVIIPQSAIEKMTSGSDADEDGHVIGSAGSTAAPSASGLLIDPDF